MEAKKVYFCYRCNELYYSSNSAVLKCPNCKENLTPLDVTSDKWEFMTDDEHDELLKSKMPSPPQEKTIEAKTSAKAMPVRFCLSCEKSFTEGETECPRCKGQLVGTRFSSLYWNKCSAEERKKYISEYVEKTRTNSDSVSVVKTQEKIPESTSSCASWIKGLALIITILSVIGSFFIMSEAGFPTGFAILLVCVLTGSLAYGIGEIIEQLTQINSKLK